jgi:probable HAF family extracellular repeat protein
MMDLTPLIHTFSSAQSINDRGQIVGIGEGYSFLWQHGTITDLVPGLVSDINDRGQIVGVGDDGIAFFWQDGTLTNLGTLGGEGSTAFSINNRGQIVGVSLTADEKVAHAFLWQDGITTDLGTLGGAFSSAEAINDRGQITGFSETASGDFHAVLWTK